jgi:CDP-diacylglycerol pyrophosphatase
VRGFLGEELQAAYDFLTQERQQPVWAELPGWNLAELIRSRRINELELRRRAFFDSLQAEGVKLREELEASGLAARKKRRGRSPDAAVITPRGRQTRGG